MSLKPVNRQINIVVQELEKEVLIYDLNLSKAFCLNETSAIIWQLCDGTKTVAEISQAAGKKLNVNISEDFVWLALEQFKKDQLISDEFEFKNIFEGMSRREIIRQVGFASMAALPVVASIIAPVAANAQSACIAEGNNCSAGVCCAGTLCASNICQCMCSSPGDCLTQTSCPSTTNCNANMVCAP